jgi:hypothetical protein
LVDAGHIPDEPAGGPADPLWQRAPLLLERDLGVFGRRLMVRSNTPAGLSLADAAFGGFAPAEPAASTIALDIIVGRGMRGQGGGPAESSPLHREHDELYLAAAKGSATIADLRSRRIKCFVDDLAPPDAAVIIESPVWRCLAWSGMVAIHAACIRLKGRSLVLRGAAGAGKSTLAAFAWLSGAALLAEESVWFDPAGAQPCLRGAPFNLRLEPDSLAILGAALPAYAMTLQRAAFPTPEGAGKLRIETAGIGPLPVIEQCELGPLIFLERDPSVSAANIRRLDRSQALERFEADSTAGERSQRAPDRLMAAEGLLAEGAFELRFSGLEQGLQALASIDRGPSPSSSGPAP